MSLVANVSNTKVTLGYTTLIEIFKYLQKILRELTHIILASMNQLY